MNLNLYGSYRRLFKNSKQAMFAAIEIYNKPKIDYREEVFVILLVNAWDLLLLAILAKNKKRIFQKKKRNIEYKTLPFDEAYNLSKTFFLDKEKEAYIIKKNLKSIREYRNDAIHYYYYADSQTDHAFYALSQSAIKNYVDLSRDIFGEDITKEINTCLLPLSFNEQPNFVEFFQSTTKEKYNPFVQKLFENKESIEGTGDSSDRFVAQCSVKIETIGNIKSADSIAIYDSKSGSVAIKKVNPDDTYPFYQKDIIGNRNASSHPKLKRNISWYQFQAIVTPLKTVDKYCWVSEKGGSPRYSFDVIEYINNLSDADITEKVEDRKRKMRQKRNNRSHFA